MKKETGLMSTEIIERKIYLIRGMKVMLDSDLAELYQVETRTLIQAVKRNVKRFPPEFMFQVSEKEFKKWRSQIVMSNPGAKMGLRRPPYTFTEHGVTMLASVLRSKKAVEISIYVVKAFIKLREMIATHKNLIREFEKMKRTQKEHGQHIVNILNVISQLLNPPPDNTPKEPMGFRERSKD
jgi:phage regulator Rha-like protein